MKELLAFVSKSTTNYTLHFPIVEGEFKCLYRIATKIQW
jgi:hypothetical protein